MSTAQSAASYSQPRPRRRHPGPRRPSGTRRDAALPIQALRVRAPGASDQPTALGGHETALTTDEMHAERDAALRGRLGSLGMLHAEAAETALLSAEEERVLFTRVQAGDRAALEQAVAANVRLVGAVARYFARATLSGSGGVAMDLDDLMQEGMVGLWKAATKFEPQRGHKFSTYATWWIRQTISRALVDRGSAIRLPAHLDQRCRTINRLSLQLEAETGQKPDAATLAARLGIEERAVTDALAAWALRLAPLSLDDPITPHTSGRTRASARGRSNGGYGHGEGDLFTLADVLANERAEDAFEDAERRADACGPESISGIIADLRARGKLSARDVEIIERRALKNEPLEAVRHDFGVSRERIRQLEMAAYKRIREERARRRAQGGRAS